MEVNGNPKLKLFVYQHSSKYIICDPQKKETHTEGE